MQDINKKISEYEVKFSLLSQEIERLNNVVKRQEGDE